MPVSKPSNPAILSSDPSAATIQFYLPMCETTLGDAPLDLVSRTCCRPFSATAYQTGRTPLLQPTGFNPGAAFTDCQAIKMAGYGASLRQANLAGGGGNFAAGGGNNTHFCLMRIDYIDQSHPGAVSAGGTVGLGQKYILFCSESNTGGHGICIKQVGSTYNLGIFTNNNDEYTTGTIPTLSTGHWYGIVTSFSSASNGSVAAVVQWVYDFTSASWVTSSTTGTTWTSVGLVKQAAIDNTATVAPGFLTGSTYPGMFAGLGIDRRIWGQTDVAAFVADPFNLARGNEVSLTVAALTGPDAWCTSLTGGNGLTCGFPTTSPAGLGATYSYQWLTVAAYNSAGSSGTPISGATSKEYLDTAAAVGVGMYYCCKVTDSASNVAYSNVVFGQRVRGHLNMLFIGDNQLSSMASTSLAIGYVAHYRQYIATVINRGKLQSTAVSSGTSSTQCGWDPTAPNPTNQSDWLSSAIAEADYATLGSASAVKYAFVLLGSSDTPSTGFRDAMNRICAALVTAGYKVVLVYAPFVFNGAAIPGAIDGEVTYLDQVGTDTTTYPNLIRQTVQPSAAVPGATLFPLDLTRAGSGARSFPNDLAVDHYTFVSVSSGAAFSGALWTSFERNALEIPAVVGGGGAAVSTF